MYEENRMSEGIQEKQLNTGNQDHAKLHDHKGSQEHKVVFHIDERAKWPMVIGNVKNLLKEPVAADWIVEVLVNGGAVNVFGGQKDSETEEESTKIAQGMTGLLASGAGIKVCANSLRGWGIDPQALPAGVVVVPAGVVYLVQVQAEGYAYIRP